ncbi:S-layer homology domain-containing protein [Paenibacillus whitsoniae]|nr:S-layer homology domain-containing protein [Paenibacillus whitsoniae]
MHRLWKPLSAFLTGVALLAGGLTLGGPTAGATAEVYSLSIREPGGAWNESLPFVVAEKPFVLLYSTTAAVSTSIDDALFYSRDNGVSWITLTRGEGGKLTLPMDPSLTSVRFRVHAWFDPLVGSNSESDLVSAPYPVKQPGGPSDVSAAANTDGSVTLSWLDNSNIESYYEVKRTGPDGTKVFEVRGHNETTGALTYVDSQTSKTQETWYVYQIRAVFLDFQLPDYLIPSDGVTIVESTPPLAGIKDISKIDAPIRKVSGIQPILKSGKTQLDGIQDIAKIIVDPNLIPKLDGVIVKVPDLFAGASAWALPELKQAFGLGLTTSETLGKYTEAITREDYASLAVRLYEKLTGKTLAPDTMPVFKDTNNSHVNQAYRLGIVNGLTADTFGPTQLISRQEMSVMLLRTVHAAKPGVTLDVAARKTFLDSADIADWAKDGMNFALNYGIMNGMTGNYLDPLGNTTREQAILLSLRTYLATAALY